MWQWRWIPEYISSCVVLSSETWKLCYEYYSEKKDRRHLWCLTGTGYINRLFIPKLFHIKELDIDQSALNFISLYKVHFTIIQLLMLMYVTMRRNSSFSWFNKFIIESDIIYSKHILIWSSILCKKHFVIFYHVLKGRSSLTSNIALDKS